MTTLACSSATGEHKLKLAVVRKMRNLHAFKNIKRLTDKSVGSFIDLPVGKETT